MSLAQISPLPDRLEQRGGNPDLVSRELLGVIRDAITNHPRSLQTRIGPSEVGHPCARRIAYTLLNHPKTEFPNDTPWLPTIGTSVHAWLEDQFTAVGQGADSVRYLVELTLDVGDILGVPVTGHGDLYDRVTATMIDWKVVGDTQLKKYRTKGPGQQYRSQIHLYGRGCTRRGLPVDTVMIAFLPRNGELRNAYFWHEPYDEQIALDALQRANGIALAAQALGSAAAAQLPTADAFCQRCPFFVRGSTDPAAGCPGDDAARVPHGREPALTLT